MKRLINLFSKKTFNKEGDTLKGAVTTEILNKGEIERVRNCYGALTLRKALTDNNIPFDDVMWGAIDGYYSLGNKCFYVTTKEKINFMNLFETNKVTFIVTP